MNISPKGKYLSLLIVILLISIKSYGQSEDKLGSWFIYNGFFNVSPKIELFFETQLRNYEVFGNPEVFFLRPYFNYNITKEVQTGLGIEYHKSWTYDEVPSNKAISEEFRITLQTMVFQKVGRVNFQHRYRYEFRNVDEAKLQRMRYRIQATVPLTNSTFIPGTVFVNAFNEMMIDTTPGFNFSQNRVYVAGGYQFNKALNVQVGYLAILKPGTVHNRLQFFITHKLYFYDRE